MDVVTAAHMRPRLCRERDKGTFHCEGSRVPVVVDRRKEIFFIVFEPFSINKSQCIVIR